jgi:hypothetical protein
VSSFGLTIGLGEFVRLFRRPFVRLFSHSFHRSFVRLFRLVLFDLVIFVDLFFSKRQPIIRIETVAIIFNSMLRFHTKQDGEGA